MAGEKLPRLVIGKSAHPRAFRNKQVPLEYTSNSKAWMTSAIFEEHIKEIDRQTEKSSCWWTTVQPILTSNLSDQ
jgi:hypothetical protein